jgi:hypothetical protein
MIRSAGYGNRERLAARLIAAPENEAEDQRRSSPVRREGAQRRKAGTSTDMKSTGPSAVRQVALGIFQARGIGFGSEARRRQETDEIDGSLESRAVDSSFVAAELRG